MQNHPVSFDGRSFRLEGFPNAAKAVQIDGADAEWLADHALHRSDLEFAKACLGRLTSCPDDVPVVQEAVWRSAISSFLKCFDGTGVRSPLDSSLLYGGEAAALAAYNHIRFLRNKHLIHDENPWTQCLTVAALNPKGVVPKVAYLGCVEIQGSTRDNLQNLSNLIEVALRWVSAEFDRRHAILLAHLESKEHAALMTLPQPKYTAPSAAEVTKKR